MTEQRKTVLEMSRPALAGFVAAAAMALAGCVHSGAPQALLVTSPMAPEQLATCVHHVFDRQIPLVRRRSWRGGAEIVVRDLREQPMVVVTIEGQPGGSTLRFVSDRADRRLYLDLLSNCVRLS